MRAVEGWKTELLGTVADVIDPHPSHRAPAESKEGIPFPGIGDFREDGSLDFSSCRMVDASVFEDHHNRYEVIDGTIGFGRVASIGKVVRLRPDLLPYAVSPTMAIIMPQTIDAGYLAHFLKGPQLTEQLAGLLTGTTRSSLGIELLRKLKVTFPEDPKEQERVGEVLSSLDRAIEQTEAIIAKQQRVKAGLMQDLLTKGIDEHGVIRSEATHEFKDSSLGRIPVEWEVTNLGDIINKHGGKIQTGPFGSQLHAHEYVNEGIPVVMPQDISSPGISTSKIARITEGKAKQLLRHNMLPGDLIFARRGDLSRCAWITEQQKGWICGTGCLLMRPPSKVLSPKWTAEIYRFHTTQLQVDVQAVGSTMPNLNTGILSALLISLPTYEEQVRIEEHLQAAEEYQNKMADQLTKLALQKTGLMHDLLTGTVRGN